MNKFNFNKLTPFKWFVLENFPFLEADFDALTEVQLFYKLGKEINKIIDSQNIVGTQMENVTNAFIELQNYVDNYFDNLDVQDEINNKLNEMAKDGTLQEIMSAYLNTRAIFCFDNVADLKNATNLVEGSFAKTLGFFTFDDGGGSTYKIRKVTNADVVDNLSIIALNTSTELIAELIADKFLYLNQFGCYGDGVHDDSTNINKAIEYSLKNHIKIVANDCTYLIKETIQIEDDTLYKDKYIDFSLGDFIGEINQFFNIKGSWLNIKIGTIKYTGTAYKANTIACKIQDKLWHCNINIRTILYFDMGIYMVANQGIMYNNIVWTYYNNKRNLYLDINNSYINQNYFKGGLLGSEQNDTTSYGIYVINTGSEDNTLFNNNVFEHVAFEQVGIPIHLEHCAFSTFRDIRLMEPQYSNKYFELIDCENMLFEGNATPYVETHKISDDFTIENADINNWKANCNRYKLEAGIFSKKETSTAATTLDFTFINGNLVYLNWQRKVGGEYYAEATTAETEINITTPWVSSITLVAGSGNITVKLPIQYSLPRAPLSELLINIRSLISPYKVIIKDYQDNIILDSSKYEFTSGVNINKKFLIKNFDVQKLTSANKYCVINV